MEHSHMRTEDQLEIHLQPVLGGETFLEENTQHPHHSSAAAMCRVLRRPHQALPRLQTHECMLTSPVQSYPWGGGLCNGVQLKQKRYQKWVADITEFRILAFASGLASGETGRKKAQVEVGHQAIWVMYQQEMTEEHCHVRKETHQLMILRLSWRFPGRQLKMQLTFELPVMKYGGEVRDVRRDQAVSRQSLETMKEPEIKPLGFNINQFSPLVFLTKGFQSSR